MARRPPLTTGHVLSEAGERRGTLGMDRSFWKDSFRESDQPNKEQGKCGPWKRQDLEQFREVTEGEESRLHICYMSLGKVTKPEVITV